MRLVLASILLLIAATAEGADCSKWRASMEEGEGGSRMVARSCNATGGELTLECGAPGVLMMAFAPNGDFAPPDGNPDFAGRFSIRIGAQNFDRVLTYWAMDGVMGAEIPFKNGLTEALDNADSGSISFAAPKAGIAEARFTLTGASAAVKKLKASCPRN